MPRPTLAQLALFAGVIAVLVLISWQVFDRPLGRVLVSALGGVIFAVVWWFWYHRPRGS